MVGITPPMMGDARVMPVRLFTGAAAVQDIDGLRLYSDAGGLDRLRVLCDVERIHIGYDAIIVAIDGSSARRQI